MSFPRARRAVVRFAVVIVLIHVSVHPASAQLRDVDVPRVVDSRSLTSVVWPVPEWKTPVFPVTSMPRTPQVPERHTPPEFASLYASFAALQLLDVHSTRRALPAGAHEANPLVAPFAGNTAALLAVKGATTAITLHMVETLRKRDRRLALAVLVGINALHGLIVVHNYRTETNQ